MRKRQVIGDDVGSCIVRFLRHRNAPPTAQWCQLISHHSYTHQHFKDYQLAIDGDSVVGETWQSVL